MKVRAWIAAAALMVWALAAFGAPSQKQEVRIDTLRSLSFRDLSPASMVVLSSDHHGCTEWPFTLAEPAAAANKIAYTIYVERGPDDCTGAQLTSARLASLSNSPFIELGTHGWFDSAAGVQRDHISLNKILKSFGFVRTVSTATVTGTGTNFASTDARELIFIPSIRSTPFLILDAPTDARTLTVEPATTVTTSGATYAIIDGYSVDDGFTITDGSASVTCAGCNFTANEPFISEPVPGGAMGKGSIVVIESATNNPFYVSDVTSATALTLDKNVACGGACPASRDFAIATWIEVMYDHVTESRDEIEADAGCTGCVKSWGAPNNDNNELLVPLLRRAGLASGAGINTGVFNVFGYSNFRLFDRHTFDGRTSPEGGKQLMRAAAETDGVLVINFEQLYEADYETGTVTITASSDTVDCAGGCSWTALSSGACATATDCWLFVINSTEPKSYRISTFVDSDTLTLDPVDPGTDVDWTPTVTVSASPYYIANLAVGSSTGCRTPTSGCSGTPVDTLEEIMIWLDANRDKVMAVTHSEGALRHARFSSSISNAFNLLANPLFRVVRAEMLPPGNLSVNSHSGIPGWTPSWNVAPDSGTTISVSSDGILSFTTASGTPSFDMFQRLMYTQPESRWTFGAWMDPSGVTTMTEMQVQVVVGDHMDNPNAGNQNFLVPVANATYPAGAPGAFAILDFGLTNPGLMVATYDCTPEPCAEAANALAPRPLQQSSPVDASPDPFVMDESSATAGVYTITYQPTSLSNPMVWVQAQTASINCSTDAPGVTSVVVRCVNDAGVGVDSDFRIQVYDPGLKNIADVIEVQLVSQVIGTAKWAMPTLTEGVYRVKP